MKHYETRILLDHGNVKLIREIKKIDMLNDFLEQLLNGDEVEIVGEKASLEYFADHISFGFKDKRGMPNNYYVDNACYYSERTHSNNLTGLSDVQDKLLCVKYHNLGHLLPSKINSI
jgi:hypothetical protein